MTYYLSILGIVLAFSWRCLATEYSSNELLELLNQDPSLLLDPKNQLKAPPPEMPSPPVELEREVQSVEEMPQTKVEASTEEKSEVEEKEVTEEKNQELAIETVQKTESKAPEAEKIEPQKVEELKVEEKKEAKKEEALPQATDPQPVLVQTPEVVIIEAPPVVAQPVAALPVVEPTPPSQLVALPGMNDFSIILSEKEFFPSLIKMKQTEKVRLLFISTSSKPGALVFTKPQIQRWLANEPPPTSLNEKRELGSKKVTPIEFSAEPGVYKFYDALSGASGEIQVE